MTQSCLRMCCWVTETPRKSDIQEIWCQRGATWLDSLINNITVWFFMLDLFDSQLWVGDRGHVHVLHPHGWHVSKNCVGVCRVGGWGVGAYARSQWRCHPPKLSSDPHRHMSTQQLANPTQPKHTHTHTFTHSVSTAHRAQIINTMAVPCNKRGI